MTFMPSVRLRALPALVPIDGKNVELQSTPTFIQWRNSGDAVWQNLIAVSAITGPQGVPGPSGVVQAIVGGTNISVDNTNPANPIVSTPTSILPTLTANTMLVDNATATLRESKTFAQVRTSLEAIAVSELGALEAWNRGVPGDASDQTTALQTLVNSLPPEGGQIILKGDVRTSSLNLQGKRNIKFLGIGGNGAGAAQRSILRSDAGAIGVGNRVIDARDSFNISFTNLQLNAPNTAFTGRFIDFSNITTGSALMSFDDCYMQVNGVNARGLWLYGATQGSFERVTFSGTAYIIQLQNAVGVGWCNLHNFRSCNFTPSGSHEVVLGSGEGITFDSCNVQASSADGKGYFWNSDLGQPFKGVTIRGCTFYDALTTNFIWSNFYTGSGLVIQGNRLGGAANVTAGGNYGFNIGGGTAGASGAEKGVTGISVLSNVYEFGTVFVVLAGTAGSYNNVRKGAVKYNTVSGTLTPSGKTLLVSNASSAVDIVYDANYINAGPNDMGSRFNMKDIPTSATGLNPGDIWCDTSAGNVLKKV